jgi:hypothetical protein
LELSDDEREDEKEEEKGHRKKEKEERGRSVLRERGRETKGDMEERNGMLVSPHETLTVAQYDPIGDGGDYNGVNSRHSGTADSGTMESGRGETSSRQQIADTADKQKQKTKSGRTADSRQQSHLQNTLLDGGDGGGGGDGGDGDDVGNGGNNDKDAAVAAREWSKRVEESMQRAAEEVCKHNHYYHHHQYCHYHQRHQHQPLP